MRERERKLKQSHLMFVALLLVILLLGVSIYLVKGHA